MTTKVKVTLEEYHGYPVEVRTVSLGKRPQYSAPQFLHEVGDSVLVYVHQNQDIHIGEIKTNAA